MKAELVTSLVSSWLSQQAASPCSSREVGGGGLFQAVVMPSCGGKHFLPVRDPIWTAGEVRRRGESPQGYNTADKMEIVLRRTERRFFIGNKWNMHGSAPWTFMLRHSFFFLPPLWTMRRSCAKTKDWDIILDMRTESFLKIRKIFWQPSFKVPIVDGVPLSSS